MTTTSELLSLRLKNLWRFFAAQGFVYWAMCCYLFIEYVRPQSLFRPLEGVPVGQIVLGAALLAHVGSGRWFAMKGPVSWLLLLFTAVIVASSIAAYSPGVAIGKWRLWFSWVVIYFLIVNVVKTERQLVFFTLLWLLFHYYMAQGGAKQFALRGFRFQTWGVIGAPGWFQNSGEFGIAMCMFVAVSWHFYVAARPFLAKWQKLFVLGMPATAILSIIGSSSRGAVLGLAAVGAWEVLRGKHRVRAAVGLAVLAAALWLVVPTEFKARFAAAGDDGTSIQRKHYWKNGLDMARKYPILGVGYGNWMAYYSGHYVNLRAAPDDPARRIQLPHNIFIHCVAELGVVGLVAFLLLIFATLRIDYQTRRIVQLSRGPPGGFVRQMALALDGAMIGYLTCGLFVTVLYYPFFWINLAFTVALNSIARRQYGIRARLPRGPRGFGAGMETERMPARIP